MEGKVELLGCSQDSKQSLHKSTSPTCCVSNWDDPSPDSQKHPCSPLMSTHLSDLKLLSRELEISCPLQ